MPYLSKDQIAAAREMDLLTYLRRFEPQELVHIGGDTYATRTHDSLKISNGKWCWWSRNIGGTTALDYLTRVERLSFLDAVQRILGEPPRVPPKSEPIAPLPKTEFTLPPKHADNRRVFAYLRGRGIDAEIINHCIKHGQLYEDAERHNCVFVGYKYGTPAYGALRGTLSETTFAGEVSGSDKRFSFACFDCHSFPSSLSAFDLIIANHVLFYCNDLPKVFKQIQRSLKKGGHFLCSTYGKRHMIEISELVQEFDSRIVLSAEKLYEQFGLENGEALLKPYFSDVQCIRYEDSIELDRAEPLIEYILSCHGNQNQMLLERYHEFRSFVEKKTAHGFHITKDAGIFLCTF